MEKASVSTDFWRNSFNKERVRVSSDYPTNKNPPWQQWHRRSIAGLIVRHIKMQVTTVLFAIILNWLRALRERLASAPRKQGKESLNKTRLEVSQRFCSDPILIHRQSMEPKPRSSSGEKFRRNKVSVASAASQRAVQVEMDIVPAVDSTRKVTLITS